MMNMDITSKYAYKLLQQLESDPQLQSVEDTSILNDEQYPTSFESAITNLKDIIPLISAVTILRWNDQRIARISLKTSYSACGCKGRKLFGT
jgi:hypothetical protein